jgi:hypothetical protein
VSTCHTYAKQISIHIIIKEFSLIKKVICLENDYKLFNMLQKWNHRKPTHQECCPTKVVITKMQMEIPAKEFNAA